MIDPRLTVRVDIIRAALGEVCPFTRKEFFNKLAKEPNPEVDVFWWERVAGCFARMKEPVWLSLEQNRAAFMIIYWLFSGSTTTQLADVIAQLPHETVQEILAAVRLSVAR